MQGPKVEQWAARKGEELTIAVLGDPDNYVAPTHQDNDEALWTGLLMALRTAYLEYHSAEGVYREIKDLCQKEGHVDNYIVEFENLLSKVEWGRDQHGTIAAFKDEEQSFYQLKFDLAEARRHRTGRRLGDMARDASKSKKPAYNVDPCPYDPMQLDVAWIQKLTDEEHQKLLKEKKCFYCKKLGHMFANCKERPKTKDKGKGRMKRCHPGPRVCAASATSEPEEESEEEEEAEKDKKAKDVPPAYTKKNLMTAIKKLSIDEREDLMETMALESDQDF
jgi:hypothetical protein